LSTDGSPLKRSIGLSGVVRWLIAFAAVIAVAAAAAAGRYGLAVVLAVFVVVAVVLGYRATRAAS